VTVQHILFVRSRNQLRSPTAEQVFSGRDGIEVVSVELDPKSKEPVRGWSFMKAKAKK
jgi:predicted protein tyrosine phosphatase